MYNSFIIIIFGFILFIVYYWYFTSKIFNGMPKEMCFEMEDIFIQEISNGEHSRRIANIYSLSNLIIIKSLFQSEQIPFFCEFEHFSKIKTGLPITQINNIILNLLEKDINDSKFILQEYQKNKINNVKILTKIRYVFECIFISNIIPSAETSSISIIVE